MRICLVTTFFPPEHFGGDAVFVASLANLLASAGHLVEVVHSVDAFELLKESVLPSPFPLHPSVKVHGLRSKSPSLAQLAIHVTGHPMLQTGALRDILEQDFDVVHWHNLSLIGGPGALKIPRAIQLCTLHDYWWFCPTSILFKYNREVCRAPNCVSCTLAQGRPPQLWRYGGIFRQAKARVSRFLAPSEFVKRRYQESPLHIQACVLPHFAAPAAAAERRGRQDYYFYAGRLERAKGLQAIIPLFAETKRRLLIAGSGRYEEELKNIARGQPGVEFLGKLPHPDLAPLFAGARATLVPSICYETFGLTVLESLQQKTPVIVSDFGAPQEIVQRTGGGLIYSTRQELERHLNRMDSDPAYVANLGEAGYARLDEYSPDRHLLRYEEIVAQERAREGAVPVP